MGAAKNARKARRKADRREDRRPYFYSLKDVQAWAKPWHTFPGPSTEHVTLVDAAGVSHHIGYRENLTHQEAKKLLASGLSASKEPKTWKEHERHKRSVWFDIETIFSDPDKRAFVDYFMNTPFPRISQDIVRHRSGRINSMFDIPFQSLGRTVTNNKMVPPLQNLDFSDIEARIMETLDKKAAYAALYGAAHVDVQRIYDDALVPAHIKADALARTYRGQRIGDIVSSHPLNQRSERDDEDHQEVARVSGDRS